MSKCGIDIRGRARKLYLNYRTTDEIRRQGVAVLEGVEIDDLDDGHDETRRYKSLSHGPAPQMMDADGLEQAAQLAHEFIAKVRSAGDGEAQASVCVIAPSEKIREAIAQQLQTRGHVCTAITAQSNHADAKPTVHLATMHRAKGLEFDSVVVLLPGNYLGDRGCVESIRWP